MIQKKQFRNPFIFIEEALFIERFYIVRSKNLNYYFYNYKK